METAVPWRSYSRAQLRAPNQHGGYSESEKEKDKEKESALPRPMRTCARRAAVVGGEKAFGDAVELREPYRHRTRWTRPKSHLVQERLTRVPVYDEPFAVFGRRSREMSEQRTPHERKLSERGKAKVQAQRVPSAMRASLALGPTARGSFASRQRHLSRAGARHYFRLQSDRALGQARRIQGWWRCVLARRHMQRLLHLFVETRYDDQSGQYYQVNTKTGKSEWL